MPTIEGERTEEISQVTYPSPGGARTSACRVPPGCVRLRGRGWPYSVVGGKAPWQHGKRWILCGSILRVRANGLHDGARLLRTTPSIEPPVGGPRAVLCLPSLPSSRIWRVGVQGKMRLSRVRCFGCRRHHPRRRDGKSGLTDLGLLDGAYDDTLRELRQTWPHHGEECVATCIDGSTNPFQMIRGRVTCGTPIIHPGGSTAGPAC